MGPAPAPIHKEGSPRSKGPLIKGVLLVVFLLSAAAMERFTSIKSYLTPA
ncbi:MAG: hypothetical protein H6Q83_1162, partial [Deltaproteobacteria bacterium]|nr:hypothetical protein [Deltaproteobacteria bacterium]